MNFYITSQVKTPTIRFILLLLINPPMFRKAKERQIGGGKPRVTSMIPNREGFRMDLFLQ